MQILEGAHVFIMYPMCIFVTACAEERKVCEPWDHKPSKRHAGWIWYIGRLSYWTIQFYPKLNVLNV